MATAMNVQELVQWATGEYKKDPEYFAKLVEKLNVVEKHQKIQESSQHQAEKLTFLEKRIFMGSSFCIEDYKRMKQQQLHAARARRKAVETTRHEYHVQEAARRKADITRREFTISGREEFLIEELPKQVACSRSCAGGVSRRVV